MACDPWPDPRKRLSRNTTRSIAGDSSRAAVTQAPNHEHRLRKHWWSVIFHSILDNPSREPPVEAARTSFQQLDADRRATG